MGTAVNMAVVGRERDIHIHTGKARPLAGEGNSLRPFSLSLSPCLSVEFKVEGLGRDVWNVSKEINRSTGSSE